jgi:type IV pilus assembly protein PilA
MFNYLTMKLRKKNRGFTLIELIVVIGILAILAALAIPAVAGYLNNSKARTNMSNAKIIYNAAQAYLAANPDATEVTMDNLTDDGYLASVPKTAENDDYALDDSDLTEIHVTWENNESGLDIETQDYPGT